jgi:hypothetical protein
MATRAGVKPLVALLASVRIRWSSSMSSLQRRQSKRISDSAVNLTAAVPLVRHSRKNYKVLRRNDEEASRLLTLFKAKSMVALEAASEKRFSRRNSQDNRSGYLGKWGRRDDSGSRNGRSSGRCSLPPTPATIPAPRLLYPPAPAALLLHRLNLPGPLHRRPLNKDWTMSSQR